MGDKKYLLEFMTYLSGHRAVMKGLKALEVSQDKLRKKVAKSSIVSKQYSQTLDENGKIIGSVTNTVHKVGKEFIRQTTTVNKAGVATHKYATITAKAGGAAKGFVANLKKLAGRALMVIPIWLLLRGAVMGLIQGIKEGIQYWKEMNKALLKAKAVIHGVGGDIERAYKKLQVAVRELAQETGISMTKLTSSFYRFGTVGLKFEESIAGMKTATKLAITMFGDVDKIARILAKTYRLLGDSMDATLSPQEKMNKIGAQLYGLWKTNAFEIDEMMGALERFLPTANVFNFTMSESIGLLASLQTAGLRGTRAGRLLRTSISKLINNLSQVADVLGVYTNPRLESTFDILMKVLDKVNDMRKSGADMAQVYSATNIFGGVRSRQAGLALVALHKTLKENIDLVKKGDMPALLKKWEESFDEIKGGIDVQLNRFTELKKQGNETFLKLIFGGEKFADTVKNINTLMQSMIDLMKLMETKPILWTPEEVKEVELWNYQAYRERREQRKKAVDEILKDISKLQKVAESGEMTLKQALQLRLKVHLAYRKKATDWTKKEYESQMNEVGKLITMEKIEATVLDDLRKKEALRLKDKYLLGDETRNTIREAKEELRLTALKLKGASEVYIAQQELNNSIRQYAKIYLSGEVKGVNIAKKRSGYTVEQLKAMGKYEAELEKAIQFITEGLELDEKSVGLLIDKGINEEKINEFLKLRTEIIKEQLSARQKMVDTFDKAEISMLKVMGASELQILSYKEKQLEADRANIHPTQYLLRLGKLRTQQVLATLRASRQEGRIAGGLGIQYAKARQEEERAREEGDEKAIKASLEQQEKIRAIAALRTKSASELISIWKGWKPMSGITRENILEAVNYMSEETKRRLGKAIAESYGITYPGMPVEPPEIDKEKLREMLPGKDEISEMWQIWLDYGMESADLFKEYFAKTMAETTTPTPGAKTPIGIGEVTYRRALEYYPGQPEYQAIVNELVATKQLNVFVSMKKGEEIAEEAGEKVKEAILKVLRSQEAERIDKDLFFKHNEKGT